MLLLMYCILASTIGLGWGALVVVRRAYAVSFTANSSTFDCPLGTSSHIRWDYKTSASSFETQAIFNGDNVNPNFVDRYAVESDTNTSRLTVRNVTSRDAGIYSCANVATQDNQLIAELTVLDAYPQCSSTVGDEVIDSADIAINCRVCSHGVIKPHVTCYNTMQPPPTNNESIETSRSCTHYRWTFVTTPKMDGSQFVCNVLFQAPDKTIFNYTWSSRNIDVIYSPRSVVISPVNGTRPSYGDGSVFRCTADGNPPPTFSWIVAGSLSDGPEFVLDICKLARVGNCSSALNGTSTVVGMICMCDNKLKSTTADKSSINVSFTEADIDRCCPKSTRVLLSRPTAVSDLSTSASPLNVYTLIGGASAAGVLIVVVIIITCLACRHCRRTSSATDDKRGGLYNPNNPFYDDAQTGGSDHYDQLPTGYSGLRNSDGQYEEIPDESATDILSGVDSSHPPPYQHLSSEQREPPRPPGAYRRLGDRTVPVDTTSTTDVTSGYIDVIEVDAKPTPYRNLKSESRDQPAPSGEYRQLGDTIDAAASHGHDDECDRLKTTSLQRMNSEHSPLHSKKLSAVWAAL